MVTIAIDAAAQQHPIDPRIYGANICNVYPANGVLGTAEISALLRDANIPFNRYGGELGSRYNWSANAWNLLRGGYFRSTRATFSNDPGRFADDWIVASRAGGAEPSVTIPMIGWAARLNADFSDTVSYSVAKYGPQKEHDPNDSNAGNGLHTDGSPVDNDPQDAHIRVDNDHQRRWLEHLHTTFAGEPAGDVRYFTLDNEPGLWQHAHPDIRRDRPAAMAEVAALITAYSDTIKDAFPDAVVLGPEENGWFALFYSGLDKAHFDAKAPGPPPDRTANGDNLRFVLAHVRRHHEETGRRLLDVVTVHYYPNGEESAPEVVSRDEFHNRGDNPKAPTYLDYVLPETQRLRNRSTRSLWDPTYTDVSWIGRAGPDGGVVRLIPRLKQWVAEAYAGAGPDLAPPAIGITEYSWGAEDHMNGATAQADVLGIFGREGLDLANYFPVNIFDPLPHTLGNAFRMYRNYDGLGSTFGETSVLATAPEPDEVSAFASRRADGALTVMVVNKALFDPAAPETQQAITVELEGFVHAGSAKHWLLAAILPADQTATTITGPTTIPIDAANVLTVSVPMQSVSLFVVAPAE